MEPSILRKEIRSHGAPTNLYFIQQYIRNQTAGCCWFLIKNSYCCVCFVFRRTEEPKQRQISASDTFSRKVTQFHVSFITLSPFSLSFLFWFRMRPTDAEPNLDDLKEVRVRASIKDGKYFQTAVLNSFGQRGALTASAQGAVIGLTGTRRLIRCSF